MPRVPGVLEGQPQVEREILALTAANTPTPALIEFGQEHRTFVFRFLGGRPAEGSVYVSPGGLQRSGRSGNPLTEGGRMFDPAVVKVVKLDLPTAQISVFNSAQAGMYLEVYGIDGDADAEMTPLELAAAIAAAMAGVAIVVSGTVTATIPDIPLAWGSGVPVAMGAASATIVAANVARRGIKLENTGAVPVAICYRAAAAVFANDIILPVGGIEEQVGQKLSLAEFRGITAGAAGEIRVTEAT